MSKEDQIVKEQEEIARIRTPKSPEILGIVEMMLGGDKLRVKCDDGKTRICRIPGKLRKKVWIRTEDLVLIEPWSSQSDERGDVVFKYTPTQANWLEKKGIIKSRH